MKTDRSASITSKLIKEESVCLQLLQFDWYDYTSSSEVCSGTRLVSALFNKLHVKEYSPRLHTLLQTLSLYSNYPQTRLLLPNKIHNKLCEVKKNLWFFGIINMAMLVRLVITQERNFFCS